MSQQPGHNPASMFPLLSTTFEAISCAAYDNIIIAFFHKSALRPPRASTGLVVMYRGSVLPSHCSYTLYVSRSLTYTLITPTHTHTHTQPPLSSPAPVLTDILITVASETTGLHKAPHGNGFHSPSVQGDRAGYNRWQTCGSDLNQSSKVDQQQLQGHSYIDHRMTQH